MLVTFSCDAHENITMFGEVALRLLKMMGHSGTVPSAILAENIPEALSLLTQALEQDKKKSAIEKSEDDEERVVGIGIRALPLVQLLRDAIKRNCDVIWR